MTICYFFITDQIKNKEIKVMCCPTEEMTAAEGPSTPAICRLATEDTSATLWHEFARLRSNAKAIIVLYPFDGNFGDD